MQPALTNRRTSAQTTPRELLFGPARPKSIRKIELDILALLSQGMTNRDIADHLRLSVPATKWHLHQLFGKLAARNRIEVIKRAPQVFALGLLVKEFRLAVPTRETLTKAELNILALLDQGMTNREIASNLSMTLGTIKWHLTQIFAKLQARNRVHALTRAYQLKCLSNNPAVSS
jgi:ATP/maltotriose-dependent transcriptional regulator MalT